MSILQASGCYGNGELKFICNSRTLDGHAKRSRFTEKEASYPSKASLR